MSAWMSKHEKKPKPFWIISEVCVAAQRCLTPGTPDFRPTVRSLNLQSLCDTSAHSRRTWACSQSRCSVQIICQIPFRLQALSDTSQILDDGEHDGFECFVCKKTKLLLDVASELSLFQRCCSCDSLTEWRGRVGRGGHRTVSRLDGVIDRRSLS